MKDNEFEGWPDDWQELVYDGEFITNSCTHEFRNVGFNHVKMVCIYCDGEEI